MKGTKSSFSENTYINDEVEILPQNDDAYDYINDYFEYVLERDSSGNNQKMSVGELKDFYQSIEEEGLDLSFDEENPDYIIRMSVSSPWDTGERVYDVMSLIYDAEKLEESKVSNKEKFMENSNKSERIFLAAKTSDAKTILEDAGYKRTGIVFELTVEELADILENYDISEEEIDVKDENGEPIEDVYSLAFESNDDDIYDEDYADFDFEEEDDDDYVDPSFFELDDELDGFDE